MWCIVCGACLDVHPSNAVDPVVVHFFVVRVYSGGCQARLLVMRPVGVVGDAVWWSLSYSQHVAGLQVTEGVCFCPLTAVSSVG